MDPVIYGEIIEVHGLVGATKKFYCVIVVVLVNGQHLFPFTSDVAGVVPPRDVETLFFTIGQLAIEGRETSRNYCLTYFVQLGIARLVCSVGTECV